MLSLPTTYCFWGVPQIFYKYYYNNERGDLAIITQESDAIYNQSLTWQNGDGFESAKDPEGTQAREVAHFDEAGEVPGEYHKEIEPVPRRPQISVVVQYESFGNNLDAHLERVEAEENVPIIIQRERLAQHTVIFAYH